MYRNKMKTTPLRNSSSANKPFRSPFSNITENLKESGCKRRISEQLAPVKRLKRENDEGTQECVQSDSKVTYNDLNAIKKRIREKRQNISCLKTRLMYNKKHKKEDLEPLIEKWREVCQEALDRFLKDAQDRQDPSLTMTQVLSQLGVPESLVYKTDADEVDNTDNE